MYHLNKLSLLALAGLKSARPEEDTNMYFPVSFDVGGAVVLSELMQNPDVFNDVLDHGCHCSLLDLNANHEILGGHEPVDELDSICRQWLIARNCNDQLVGGSCYGLDTVNMTYTVYEDLDYIPHCQPTDDSCKADACKIDLYYATMIMDHVMWNPMEVKKVELPGTCQYAELPTVNRVCEGSAPDVQVRVLGEKLTHRILSVDELKQECSTAPFDLTILVDGSGSVLPTDYAGSLDFIQELLSMFTYGSEGTRVTLAQFSTDLMTYTTMNDDQTDVLTKLDLMRRTQYRRGTMTNSALDQMVSSIENFGRPQVKQYIIVLTDGSSNNGVSNSVKLHDNGVTVFSIGVGSGIDSAELSEMASDPANEYLYMIDDFDVLQDVYMMLTIGSNICVKANEFRASSEAPAVSRSFGKRPPAGVQYWYNPEGGPSAEDVLE